MAPILSKIALAAASLAVDFSFIEETISVGAVKLLMDSNSSDLMVNEICEKFKKYLSENYLYYRKVLVSGQQKSYKNNYGKHVPGTPQEKVHSIVQDTIGNKSLKFKKVTDIAWYQPLEDGNHRASIVLLVLCAKSMCIPIGNPLDIYVKTYPLKSDGYSEADDPQYYANSRQILQQIQEEVVVTAYKGDIQNFHDDAESKTEELLKIRKELAGRVKIDLSMFQEEDLNDYISQWTYYCNDSIIKNINGQFYIDWESANYFFEEYLRDGLDDLGDLDDYLEEKDLGDYLELDCKEKLKNFIVTFFKSHLILPTQNSLEE